MPHTSNPVSAANLWPPIARFIAAEERLGQRFQRRGPVAAGAYEFLRFGIKQGWACLFGGALLALIIGTRVWYPHGTALARYDFLVISALVLQAGLLAGRLETLQEAKVILLFHAVATIMEIFKVHMGSWAYPEPSRLRLYGVPLFAGFMYASIGSYIARAWRLFDFRFTRHPPPTTTLALALAVYANFFLHHFMADMRLFLFAAAALLFGRTTVWFKVWHTHRHMPLLLGFALVAFFIWLAENIGTAAGAWLYPSQAHGWALVSPAKLGAWFLLMIISYVMVSWVNPPQPYEPTDQ